MCTYDHNSSPMFASQDQFHPQTPQRAIKQKRVYMKIYSDNFHNRKQQKFSDNFKTYFGAVSIHTGCFPVV